jgi:uncharacterized Zn-binding protein involved in type VI secretion
MGQPAARATGMHTCPTRNGPVPHVGGPILPAARLTDKLTYVGPPDVAALGSFTVFVGKLPAARMGRCHRTWRRDRGRLPDRADRMKRRC